MKKPQSLSYIKIQLPAICSLIFLLLLGVYFYLIAHPVTKEQTVSSEQSLFYETALVTDVHSDTCEPDEISEGLPRGRQELTALVKTGPHAGKSYQLSNYVNPLYGHRLATGDSFTIVLSVYEDLASSLPFP